MDYLSVILHQGWLQQASARTIIEKVSVDDEDDTFFDDLEDDRQNSTNVVQEKGFNFDDARLMRGAWRNEPNPDLCQEFFRCLAICHTVLPEGEETPEKVTYQAA